MNETRRNNIMIVQPCGGAGMTRWWYKQAALKSNQLQCAAPTRPSAASMVRRVLCGDAELLEQVCAQVALAVAGEEHRDELASILRARSHLRAWCAAACELAAECS